LFQASEAEYDPNSLFGYEKIYQNAQNIENFFSKKTETHYSPKKFEPFTIYATILSANNLDMLNKG